ncbi:hypothetical protein [Zhihengliuella salsuginis]|uniref:Uncharacterized protein n=1 Tax=Zhihengliuella salsuginis TaxID=578222 RepID=A0ABQ3GB20_9MICC|nr:hypothetical protein [Zhihengliuella salsuginis]GHD00033.1 hypothetical protein GCM10008096_02810 [Zhihengliuella salsuginis]
MRRSAATGAVALVAVILTAAVSGCGGSAAAGESPLHLPAADVPPAESGEAGMEESHERSGELTVLSSRITEAVGVEDFGQSWIEDGALHVAVTTEAAAATATEAGAIAHVVRFSEADLMEAARSVVAWTAAHRTATGGLGRITLDALGERIVVGVDPGRRDQVATAFDATVAGGVEVVFEATGGPAGTR